MKHIVIVGKYYPPEFGGVERYTSEVARSMSDKYRITVLVHNRAPDDKIERDGNVTVIRCGTTKIISSQPLSPSMLMRMRTLNPDLVHFNAPNFWGAAMLLLTRYRGPLVVTHHADVFGRPVLRRVVMPIYRRLVRRATCVVVNSLKNAAASKDLPRGAGPFVEIPHGVDPRAYNLDGALHAELTVERRERFGSSPVIGFVGRFVRYKGLSVLIEALSRLPGVHALLIGNGPLRPQVEEQVRTAGIADRVHFLGDLDERGKIRGLAMMDVLVLPSVDTTETFGVVQIEAQLMGLPVVASRLPTGVTDVTIDNETGLLVTPRDPDALATAISRLLDDRDLARRLGRAGYEHAHRRFTLDVFERRFIKLFEAILSGRSFDDLIGSTLTAPQQRRSS